MMYTNKGISIKEYKLLMVLSDFSDRIIWGYHTGLHDIRKYGNNVSNNHIYSAVIPCYFTILNWNQFMNDKEELLWFKNLTCILECPFFSYSFIWAIIEYLFCF